MRVARTQEIWHGPGMAESFIGGTMPNKRKKSPSNMAGMEAPDVSERLNLLFRAFQREHPTPAAFAAKVGLSYNQWNNVSKQGYPLSKEIAFKLVRAFPGLSTDWLWFGKWDTLSYPMIQRLEAASKGLNGTTTESA
jgi:hypothetical protein